MSTTRTLITMISLSVLLSATAIEAQPSALAGGSSDVTTSITETLSLDETRETPTPVLHEVKLGDTTLYYESAGQIITVLQVLDRLDAAGLELPPVNIKMQQRQTCSVAGSMWTDDGEYWIKICAGHRTLLHELGHVWDRHNLTESDREELLELRGLDDWGGVDWDQCGGEHLAEAIAWALDDRTLPVYRIPNNSYEELGAMYLLATGSTDAPVYERTPGLAERSRRILEERQGGDDGLTNNHLLDHGDDLGAGDTLG